MLNRRKMGVVQPMQPIPYYSILIKNKRNQLSVIAKFRMGDFIYISHGRTWWFNDKNIKNINVE